MAVANSDYVPDPFPGVTLPHGTGASGTPGSAGRAADTAATDVTPPSGAHQDAYAASAGTLQPGQTAASVISPGPQDGYTDTGAGHGRARVDSSGRYPWQQRPGG